LGAHGATAREEILRGDGRWLYGPGRYGTPAEIAAAVAHVAGDGGAYLTGAMIVVDGGFTI
jgi:NAD(P)-dependent dehydrogenase (short-subunit alcohol dehydrogenase family)